jgi:hypothetical protein
MKERTSLEIEDLRKKKYAQQGELCWVCCMHTPLSLFQLAHRIPQRKWAVKKYGKAVIFHPRNMVGVCGLFCNSRAQLDPESAVTTALAESIRGDIVTGR